MGRRSLLPGVFSGFWSSRCNPIALQRGRDNFYKVFLSFVEFKVQAYRTLGGLGSLLPSLFEVCGFQGATLSHFEGVGVTFTSPFCGLWNSGCTPITLWRARGQFYWVICHAQAILLDVFPPGCRKAPVFQKKIKNLKNLKNWYPIFQFF